MSRVWSAAAVALLVLSACKKTELPDPEPTGMTVTIDKSTLSADDGSITAQAIVYEDGVALLDYPVSFSLSGAVVASAVTQNTDPTTGVATHTFTNVRTMGAVSVNASAGNVSDTAQFTVVPGAVTSIDITPSATTLSADVGELSVATAAQDAHGNAVAAAPILI